ncbi:MAG: hypothetical protein CSA81_00915 [Acidobacteria bacterium]|nr:MAG: hypothetical protein CSA81_00915 [Acidobacteriota bacterium]
MSFYFKTFMLVLALIILSCGDREQGNRNKADENQQPPSILLVTLDTTRADYMGYTDGRADTPSLDRFAKESLVFERAFATVPMTLPSHTSMMTGQYASEHGVHENARYISAKDHLLAVELKKRGYHTAALVSSYPLARIFGLSAGFDHYDDYFTENQNERTAKQTTDLALSYMERVKASQQQPVFLWVHYFDPHLPYEPPEPYRSQYPRDPYAGEIAFMDSQFDRLLRGFQSWVGEGRHYIIVAGDHGEGLGDHGEMVHGHLLFNSTIQVPLLIGGSDIQAGRIDRAVSLRHIYHTVQSLAGISNGPSLLYPPDEVVCAEAMKPYLQYGWQPQIMAVYNHTKVISEGEPAMYDLEADPGEKSNLAGSKKLDAPLTQALENYELPSSHTVQATLSETEASKLASLGYVASSGDVVDSEAAPVPSQMTHLFEDMDRASGYFVNKQYKKAIPLLKKILETDPDNFMFNLRTAVAYSILGDREEAMLYFQKAMHINPDSIDLMHYLGMHYFRFKQLSEAETLLEQVLKSSPNRIPALQCMARIKEIRQDKQSALDLFSRLNLLNPDDEIYLLKMGDLSMELGQTEHAIACYLNLKDQQLENFNRDFELSLCLMDAGRLEEARDTLDGISTDHKAFPLVLLKRAQVSILLKEPHARSLVRQAYQNGNSMTRRTIENEPFFNSFLQ